MWKNIQRTILQLPPVLRNIYFLSAVAFAILMLFVDDNNIINQYHRRHELSALLEKKNFYLQEIGETQKESSELSTNPETQEKFAREHYWMKRDNEDVFVIVKK